MFKLLIIGLLFARGDATTCAERYYGADSIVCVCNATYCDETPYEGNPEAGAFHWYVSSKDGLRLSLSKGNFNSSESESTVLTVDSDKTFQSIFGFGGAFTDAAGLNIKKLTPPVQEVLLRSYFEPKTGSGYTLGRIPIAGTDFSTRAYTYDDIAGDIELKNFALTAEDYDYKIPYIKRAMEMNPDLKFFTTSWSAPAWMKNTNKITHGVLNKENYQIYADYIVKFFNSYKEHGVNIWAMTPGNEPFDGLVPFFTFNAMGWTPRTEAEFLAEYLVPSLQQAGYNPAMMVMDDQRFELPWFVDTLFENELAKNYTSGTAVHWYWDDIVPPKVLDDTHDHYPDKFILMTEACTGSNPLDIEHVILGSWDRAGQYCRNIIESLNHWSIGWVDWNLALDMQGGPNWAENYVDSPIIINSDSDEFYKQPMYYAIKHFSKFMPRGSLRIAITDTEEIKSTAVLTPSNEIVIVLFHDHHEAHNVTVKDQQNGANICLELPPFSISTIIYKK